MKRTIVTISVLWSRSLPQSRDLFGVPLTPAGRICFDYLSPRPVSHSFTAVPSTEFNPEMKNVRLSSNGHVQWVLSGDVHFRFVLINGCLNYESVECGTRQGIDIPCKCDPVSFSVARRPLVNPFFPCRVSRRTKNSLHSERKTRTCLAGCSETGEEKNYGGWTIFEWGKNWRYPTYEYVKKVDFQNDILRRCTCTYASTFLSSGELMSVWHEIRSFSSSVLPVSATLLVASYESD